MGEKWSGKKQSPRISWTQFFLTAGKNQSPRNSWTLLDSVGLCERLEAIPRPELLASIVNVFLLYIFFLTIGFCKNPSTFSLSHES